MSQLITYGSVGRQENPTRVHVLVPYCLKSPDCPRGRFTSECVCGCHLCDCKTIFKWAMKNNYHFAVTRGSIFYESYLPLYKESIGIIITFSCLVDEMKLRIQKVIDEFDFPMVLLTTALTCKTEEIQEAVEGGAKILNHIENLEQKLCSIEQYLRAL